MIQVNFIVKYIVSYLCEIALSLGIFWTNNYNTLFNFHICMSKKRIAILLLPPSFLPKHPPFLPYSPFFHLQIKFLPFTFLSLFQFYFKDY